MRERVIINDYPIKVDQLRIGSADSVQRDQKMRKISFDFQVTHDDYHTVTTLLYENDFIVEVPSKSLKFPAVIRSYSTSVTDLYKLNAVGDFKLELVEKT